METALYIYVDERVFTTEPLTVDSTLLTIDSTLITADQTEYETSEITNLVRRIELFNDEKISITSSIQNVNDISKVFTDYSQSFTIPASDNNNEIFRHWYENALDNGFNQNFRYSGYIEIDTQVFRTGKWQLESATVKNNRIEDYKITFYGNLVSLTDKFKEEKLKDLETLNDYTFAYSGNSVKSLVETNFNGNVAFPLISSKNVWQYGGGGAVASNWDITNNATPINYRDLFPALKIARIFEAIETKYNINFNGNFLTQSRFTDAFLWLKNKETFLNYGERVQLNFTQTFNNLPANYAGLYLQGDRFFIKTQAIDGEFQAQNNFYNFSFSASVNWRITILKDNQPFSIVTGFGDATGNKGLPNTEGSYKMFISTSEAVTFTYNIQRYTLKYLPASNNYTTYAVTGTSSGSVTSNLDILSFMPDMKITDFFTSILKMFNLTAFSYDEKNYTLEQLENWYYQGEIKDFSENCVTDFEYERIKPYKKITFEYEKSESLMNRAYNDNNQQEYGNLTSSFNTDGSDYNVKLGFENILFNKFSGTDLQVGYSINKDLQPYIPKPVILYNLKVQTGVSFKFNNGASTSTVTQYNVFGQDVVYENIQHSLNFGTDLSSFYLQPINNSLFKDYYFDYLNNLYSIKSRMVKVSMRLPYSELLGLRLNDRIVIRDKRYIINSFTTDLDTFESKFELIQDFRTLNFNNSNFFQLDDLARPFRINTVGRVGLTWSILNNPVGQIMTLTQGEDYVEVDLRGNFTKVEQIVSIQSNLGDIIVITQSK